MSFVSNVFNSTVQDERTLDQSAPPRSSHEKRHHRSATASSRFHSSYEAGISLPGDQERRAGAAAQGDRSFPSSSDDDDDDDERNDLLLLNDDRALPGSVLPAFVTRLTGGAGTRGGRGWRAYESIVPGASRAAAAGTASHVVFEHAPHDDDEFDSEEGEEEPVPGAFVDAAAAAKSTAAAAESQKRPSPAPAPPPQVLHVYPVPGPTERFEAGGQQVVFYRDAGWIVAYGVSLLAVIALALQAWWTSPPPPPPSSSLPTSSPSRAAGTAVHSLVYATLPNLIALAFVSAVAGLATVLYLSTIRRLLPALLSGAVVAGPALCLTTACLALYGSFGTDGVAVDRGWQVGVRWFAVACCVMAVVCGRGVYARQKELQRAVNVGQVRFVSLSFRVTTIASQYLHSQGVDQIRGRATARLPNRHRPPLLAPVCLLPLGPLGPRLVPVFRPHHDAPHLCADFTPNGELRHRVGPARLLVDARDREGVVACCGRRLRRDLVL